MQRCLSSLAVIVAMLGGVPAVVCADDVPSDRAPEPRGEILPQKAAEKGSARRACLILPLLSESFNKLVEPVRAGFVAAQEAGEKDGITVQLYETGDAPDDSVEAYRKALADGCKAIVGPVARNAVTALAKSGLITVPTLALNMPEIEDKQFPKQLYTFGVQVEAEARQAARYAFREGKRRAMTVSAQTPLAKRMQQSFAEEWVALGGAMAEDYALPNGRAVLVGLKDEVTASQADMVFLAVDAKKARLVRPYLGNGVPVYATSQVYGVKDANLRNVDLNGVRFVDMPWLLQPDHPAVMVYPRPDGTYTLDMERLYALGIDAYRLADTLLRSSMKNGEVLDGVTGRIILNGRHFSRELPLAEFKQGEALPVTQAKAE